MAYLCGMTLYSLLTAALITCFSASNPASISVDVQDWEGVHIAAQSLSRDFGLVTGTDAAFSNKGNIVIGTLGHSGIGRHLTKAERRDLEGKREKYLLKISRGRIIIAGSDKRGTIYGIYRLSKEIGVSPWYWWADVPVPHKDTIALAEGSFTEGEPAVRYRGIFLNDEAPALTGWVKERYGGYNHEFYVRVFELLLRLKGNFMWPAMWDAAFYDDDPLNSYYADAMGIIMGTSHHEPCARAQKEWHRYGSGPWDYSANGRALRDFWSIGIKRARNTEDIVTIGMRGDGDMPMTEGENISLLERIVEDQRGIISRETGKPASETPQVWALYKEVQAYYEKGMRVPDDVTLMLCDDNWGNVRILPDTLAAPRSGGYGIYYHFDYVGGPRNYKWLNYNDPERIKQQMDLCWKYGVKQMWIVNVGDLKPMEYPIQLFLDMAWDPESFSADECLSDFVSTQFRADEAVCREIAEILTLYGQYAHRRTAELLDADTYSFHYDEWPRVVGEWVSLLGRAEAAGAKLGKEYAAAYYQLVLFPVRAMCNIYRMYYAAACGRQDDVEKYFRRDRELMSEYNHELSSGKWNHFMDQTHIGYRWWQQPEQDAVPTAKPVGPYPERVVLPFDSGVRGPGTLIETDGYISILPASRMAGDGPATRFRVKTRSAGRAEVTVRLAPSLAFNQGRGLRYAISVDGQKPDTVNINHGYTDRQMERWQAEAINKSVTSLVFGTPGYHELTFRPLDDGIFLDKILIDFGGLQNSYLGPPQSPSE